MANLVGNFRLGRDAKKVTGANGDFFSLSLAYDAFADGDTKTQWVNATLGGARGEKLAPHLTKGSLVYAVIKDPRPTSFDGESGQILQLEGRVIELEFAGAKRRDENTENAGS